MDNIVSFPRGRKEYEAAAAWLARLDRGLDEGERAALAEWLRESSANADALVELAAVWDDLELLSELATLLPLERPVRPRRALRYVLAGVSAAAVVLAFGLGLRVWLAEPVETDPASAAVSAYEGRFATAVGERIEEALPDGSRITLNTNTEVSVRYSDVERVVDMRRGEALFSIAHDAERPFAVHAAGRIVRAVGTAFNVRLDGAVDVEVVVTEGEVRVIEADEAAGPTGSGTGRSRLLDAAGEPIGTAVAQGQGVRLGESSSGAAPAILALEPVDLDIKLAWQRGMVIFRGEPLEAVLEEFGRYTTTALVLESEELADVRVGGYFRAGDLDGLLAALRQNFGISSERVTADRVVLRAQADR